MSKQEKQPISKEVKELAKQLAKDFQDSTKDPTMSQEAEELYKDITAKKLIPLTNPLLYSK